MIAVIQAAITLGLSRPSVRCLMDAGHLPSVKVGGCRRITTGLETYVANLIDVVS